MNRRLKIALPLLALAIALVVFAAATFTPNEQPPGYISPPALSSSNFAPGTAIAYTPWFETASYRGDLLAMPVAATGAVALLTPAWRASTQLNAQHYLTGRRIATTNGSGTATAFQWASLTAAQQTAIGSQLMLNFVRGDRSNEGATTYRVRSGVLGDIIHSNPVYIGKPVGGYTFDGYLAYAAANAGRAARVAVGANDGMLHVFDAASGNEVYAYVPSMLISRLNTLAANPYTHQYFVDGRLTAGDAYFGSAWHTVLVGGLGAGGKGYFGLDFTSAAVANETDAAAKIRWEFHAGSTGATNLGYGYSRPSIARLNNGQWAAIVGNGYMSATGAASLYILNVETGSVIREIVTPDASSNGLSSPTLIDTDGDFRVDVAYAGDLNGNLWKFDLSGADPAAWGIPASMSAEPLFRTSLSGTVRQPITSAPDVGRHPQGGYMVFFGTGRLLDLDEDPVNKSQQAVYGLWDNNWGAGQVPISSGSLLTQQLYQVTHAGTGERTRTASANLPDWAVHRGWTMPIEIASASSLDLGERVIQDALLRDNRVHLMAINPTVQSGENWYLQLNALTGGAPPKIIVDINQDNTLNVADNVDGNGDGTIAEVPQDRVVGEFQSFGLVSRPVVGVIGSSADAALINHLVAVDPATVPVPDVIADQGLVGGHFDLDTSHLIYGFGNGTTDGHVHEWDDKYVKSTIDYFSLLAANLYPVNAAQNAVPSSKPFILTVANSQLSRGGVLEINGTSVKVTDYQALANRFLSGTLAPGESFPRYKTTAPTALEAAAGIQQLTSFKLSFNAFAILSADLHPTRTGCVRGNDPGVNGEYRNGALLVQALDAENIAGGYTYDAATDKWVAGSNSVHKTLGYATAGLLWESTVFWHWDGPCYGEGGYEEAYDACFVNAVEVCWTLTGDALADLSDDEKTKIKKEKDKEKDTKCDPKKSTCTTEPPPVSTSTVGVLDPGHSITNTTIAGANDAGRLFWRELVPLE